VSPTGTLKSLRAENSDAFRTADLRARVLETWATSPDRFREDANAEEDAAQAHRGRLLDELLQNAADAADEAEPGRVLIRLHADALEVANTGIPLSAAGVAALSSLRASAKRSGGATTGRFGVGFAAVLAITDEPSIRSRSSGGVRWSRSGTAAAVEAAGGNSPGLAEERHRRGDAVPVLRLPRPDPDSPDTDSPDPDSPDTGGGAPSVPDGYETLVRLPFRDAGAAGAAAAAVDALDPTLLLVLPRLAEIRIERDGALPRTLTCSWSGTDAELLGIRWTGTRRELELPAALLADRPLEERSRTRATVLAFRPAPEAPWPPGVARVLRAPQPTDDPLSLPAVLIAPFPVDAGRRRVVAGPLTDFLVDRSAEVLRDLGGTDAGRQPAPPVVRPARTRPPRCRRATRADRGDG
jgi:hypothetical protein